MVRRIRKHKCLNCRDFFHPDHRNAKRQKFCSRPECRKASKAASQQRWLKKPENSNYFSGPDNVRRVQEWRKSHPGYWRKRADRKSALQDTLSPNNKEKQMVTKQLTINALQDILTTQRAVLTGLIAQLTGCVLQDNIDITTQRLQQLGNDVLNSSTQDKGGNYDIKTSNMSATNTQDPKPIQLAGSPPG
jgi:hypothetical protein